MENYKLYNRHQLSEATGISRYKLDKVLDRNSPRNLNAEEKAKIDSVIGESSAKITKMLRG